MCANIFTVVTDTRACIVTVVFESFPQKLVVLAVLLANVS